MRFHKLDLNLLAVFDALLQHQNVSRAAEQLHLTQPTVSNALARLREHYRDDLLVMSGRRMIPTPFAETLRVPVADVLHTLRDIAQARTGFDPSTSERTIVAASSDYVAEVLLAEVGRRVAAVAPRMSLTLTPITTRTLEAIARGAVDFVVMPDIVAEACATDIRLGIDRFVPVVWQGNTRFPDTISLADYLAANHILAEVGDAGGVDAVSYFFNEAGALPRVSLRVPNFAMAAQVVVGTLHIATLPEAMARRKLRELPLRILAPDFEPPVLREMLRWPRRLDTDPANTWIRSLVTTVASEVFGPLDEERWDRTRSRLPLLRL